MVKSLLGYDDLHSGRNSLDQRCGMKAELCREIGRSLTSCCPEMWGARLRQRGLSQKTLFCGILEENLVAQGDKLRSISQEELYAHRSIRRNWLGAQKGKR